MKKSIKLRAMTALLCLLLLSAALAQAAYFTPLRLGSRGASVELMQITLDGLGYKLKTDGKFGPATLRAVRAFQRVNGLKVDGVAGSKTLTLLYSGHAKGWTPPATPPGSTPGSGVFALVATQRNRILYLRSSASARNKDNVIALMPQGARVEVLVKGDVWCKVRYGGLTGWAMTGFLGFEGTPPVIPPKVTPGDPTKAIVATQPGRSLNLRSSKDSSTKANIIAQIPSNQVVDLFDRGPSWCKVRYKGTTGYVMTGFLKFP